MIIRRANIEDIDEIISVLEKVKVFMKETNNSQWGEDYPTKEDILVDIERKQFYLILENKVIVAGACINYYLPYEYKKIDWKMSADNSYTVHRLFVNPDYKRKGYASTLINYSEKVAYRHNIFSMRLDTYHENVGMQKLLEKLGYETCGTVNFKKRTGDYLCYEKSLI